jgi:hypothetical protein
VLAAVLLGGSAIVGIASPASAQVLGVGDVNCPHESAGGGNFSSTVCLYGVVQFGDYTQFHNNTMYFIGSFGLSLEVNYGWHINHTLWAYSGAPCGEWMEIGDTQGSGPGGGAYEPGYYYYWASYTYASGYSGHIIGASDNSGNNHSYQLTYQGNGTYAGYLDGGYIGSAGGLGGGTCIGQAGEELSGSDYFGNYLAYQHSDSFQNYPLEWQDTSRNWHVGWNISQHWQDHPCNIYGYSPPNCLDLSFPNNNQLTTDKP